MFKWLRDNPFWWPWLFVGGALVFSIAAYQFGVNPMDMARLLEDALYPIASLLFAIGFAIFFAGLFLRK